MSHLRLALAATLVLVGGLLIRSFVELTRVDPGFSPERAIAPVWEANHVWLIFVIVVMFTAFPRAFAWIGTELHIPVTLLLHDWGCFYGYQFAARYATFGDRVPELPMDGHMLVSLIAPPHPMYGGRLDNPVVVGVQVREERPETAPALSLRRTESSSSPTREAKLVAPGRRLESSASAACCTSAASAPLLGAARPVTSHASFSVLRAISGARIPPTKVVSEEVSVSCAAAATAASTEAPLGAPTVPR